MKHHLGPNSIEIYRISCDIWGELAREIKSVFNIRPSVLYVKVKNIDKQKIGAAGKFTRRICTLRSQLNEYGGYANPAKVPTPNTEVTGTLEFSKIILYIIRLYKYNNFII